MRTSANLKSHVTNGCYSISNDQLIGNSNYTRPEDLDEIPSPFLTGLMDPFLKDGYYPIVETNRGCPFSCTFCVWGISALNKVLKFSMQRVKEELNYVAKSSFKSSAIVLGDANFGILPRDVQIAEHVRRGVYEAGGFPLEFPVFSASESNLRPTAMLFRNLASMDVEEAIRGNPIDGVVLLMGCDKTTPSLLMGAASCDLPTIGVSGGPMLNGQHQGDTIGSGTGVWKFCLLYTSDAADE